MPERRLTLTAWFVSSACEGLAWPERGGRCAQRAWARRTARGGSPLPAKAEKGRRTPSARAVSAADRSWCLPTWKLHGCRAYSGQNGRIPQLRLHILAYDWHANRSRASKPFTAGQAVAKPEPKFRYRACWGTGQLDAFRWMNRRPGAAGRGLGYAQAWHRKNAQHSPYCVVNEFICARIGSML